MADVTTSVEGFSISHAAILDDSGDEETYGDVYGVNSGSLDLQVGSYDNVGDNQILSIWDWVESADIQVQAGYVSFQLIALLTGSTLSSSGSGANVEYEIPLWEEGSFNVANKSMRVRVPSKDSAGNLRYIDFILYSVKFKPISFNGPAYKDGLKINYSGRAIMSSTDHTGASLTTKAVGKIMHITNS
jgi:hypothetical protein